MDSDCPLCCAVTYEKAKEGWEGAWFFMCGCGDANAPCDAACRQNNGICESVSTISLSCQECMGMNGTIGTTCYEAAYTSCKQQSASICFNYVECVLACP